MLTHWCFVFVGLFRGGVLIVADWCLGLCFGGWWGDCLCFGFSGFKSPFLTVLSFRCPAPGSFGWEVRMIVDWSVLRAARREACSVFPLGGLGGFSSFLLL